MQFPTFKQISLKLNQAWLSTSNCVQDIYQKKGGKEWLRTGAKVTLLVTKLFLGLLFLKANPVLFVVAFVGGALFPEKTRDLIRRVNNIVWYSPLYIKVPLLLGAALTLPVTGLLGNIYLAADIGQYVAYEAMRQMPLQQEASA